MEKRIVILGAGPTGLGAAYRLHKLNYQNWVIYEKNDYAGGLAASFKDENNYTWDVGGHVLFTHHKEFDQALYESVGDQYLEHQRLSHIYIADSWVPYPFQNNLRYLPKEMLYECLLGLHECVTNKSEPKTFKEWITTNFGSGITKYFMEPYNEKVWATPLSEMSHNWISERISKVEFAQALKNVIYECDDDRWGPNKTFKFPLYGGIGQYFRSMLRPFAEKVIFRKRAGEIDCDKRRILFDDGGTDTYDLLISSIPVDQLVSSIKDVSESLVEKSRRLVANKALIIGFGVAKPNNARRNWIYYPEDINPCYRVTYFSNYSPNNVPRPGNCFSLMGEMSYAHDQILDIKAEIGKARKGFLETGLLTESDNENLDTVYSHEVDYAYPVPTLERDRLLDEIQPFLEEKRIFSRGRFGYWKYEIGNMDHSFMQGYQCVDRLLNNKKESVIMQG